MSNNIAVIRGDLNAMRQQIMAALPKHVEVDRFIRTAMTAVQTSPMLLQCDRQSLLASCLEAATDGLIPDGREGAIVPYRVKGGALKAQWQPMVWGLVSLVRRSGELMELNPGTICEHDEFDYWVDEDGIHFKHRPKFTGRGKAVGVYAFARTRDGGRYFEIMDWDEVEKFRSKSKATADGTPWAEWTEQMAQARVIKRLCKRLPMQADVVEALRRDDAREAAIMSGTIDTPTNTDPIDALNRSLADDTNPNPNEGGADAS